MLVVAGCRERSVAPDPASVTALDAVALPGPDAVGWRQVELGGEPVLLFYPASGPGRAAHSPPSAPLSRRFGAAAAADLAAARGPAGHDAEPQTGTYPLVLFAPGAGLGSRDYRWLLSGLASRGMLVAGLDPATSPQASEGRVAEARDALLRVAKAAPSLAAFGRATRIHLVGHSIGGAAAVAALAGLPGARAVDLDGDFLGVSNAPAAGPVLLVSGRNPNEPARAEARRTADWQLVSNGRGQRVMLPDMRHLGATDAALLPAGRRNGDLGADPAAQHKAMGEAVAAFLSEGG